MSRQEYLSQLGRMQSRTGSQLLLLERPLLEALEGESGLSDRAAAFEDLVGSGRRGILSPPALDAAAFVQFSSGSTDEPKGAVLTPRAIGNQVLALAERLELDERHDRVVSWLPMSHDMGFFGWLTCWAHGIPHFATAPDRFLGAPQSWLDDCADYGATVTSVAPLALQLAARVEQVRPSRRRVSLRACIVGGEPIDWTTISLAVKALAPRGLTGEAVTPAYGLAEATLAVTAGSPGHAPQVIHVDGAALVQGEIRRASAEDQNSQPLVSNGLPLRGSKVRIDQPSLDGVMGEICVSSPSLASGYLNEPKRTEERFVGDELQTGDGGFVIDGELYVTGRLDDVLILGARNVHARGIELRLEREPRFRRGRIAIVDLAGTRGRGRFILVAETEPSITDLEALADDARALVWRVAGLPLDECLFLPRNQFPRTPTGKPKRYRCRELAGRRTPGEIRIAFSKT